MMDSNKAGQVSSTFRRKNYLKVGILRPSNNCLLKWNFVLCFKQSPSKFCLCENDIDMTFFLLPQVFLKISVLSFRKQRRSLDQRPLEELARKTGKDH